MLAQCANGSRSASFRRLVEGSPFERHPSPDPTVLTCGSLRAGVAAFSLSCQTTN